MGFSYQQYPEAIWGFAYVLGICISIICSICNLLVIVRFVRLIIYDKATSHRYYFLMHQILCQMSVIFRFIVTYTDSNQQGILITSNWIGVMNISMVAIAQLEFCKLFTVLSAFWTNQRILMFQIAIQICYFSLTGGLLLRAITYIDERKDSSWATSVCLYL